MTLVVLFSSLKHIFTTIKTKFKIFIFSISAGPYGVCGIFRPPVQGGSSELILKFVSCMILYNHSSYFKSGEINSCRLTPLPTSSRVTIEELKEKGKTFRSLVGWSLETCERFNSLPIKSLSFTEAFFSLFISGSPQGECANSPCQNGGTCLDYDGGYYCICSTTWQGTNCESLSFASKN